MVIYGCIFLPGKYGETSVLSLIGAGNYCITDKAGKVTIVQTSDTSKMKIDVFLKKILPSHQVSQLKLKQRCTDGIVILSLTTAKSRGGQPESGESSALSWAWS